MWTFIDLVCAKLNIEVKTSKGPKLLLNGKLHRVLAGGVTELVCA